MNTADSVQKKVDDDTAMKLASPERLFLKRYRLPSELMSGTTERWVKCRNSVFCLSLSFFGSGYISIYIF